MAEFRSRAASCLIRWFPERQIYIRSEGRVHFYVLSIAPQLLLFTLLLIFLAWASFATVNVIFKDRIIAAADHRYQNVQKIYEDRLAQAYGSLDDLNAALADAESRARLRVVVMRQTQGSFATKVARYQREDGGVNPLNSGLSNSLFQDHLESGVIRPNRQERNNASTPVTPAGSFADFAGLLSGLAHLIKGAAVPGHKATLLANRLNHPILKALEQDISRLQAMSLSANVIALDIRNHFGRAIGRIRDRIARTGIEPNQFIRKIASSEGVGGPEIPLAGVRMVGIEDQEFSQPYLEAEALWAQLGELSTAIRHVPFALPVNINVAHRSSGFGPRLDPFTGRYSFHPGLDFSGATQTAIYATAPGIVIFAGNDGTYGGWWRLTTGSDSTPATPIYPASPCRLAH